MKQLFSYFLTASCVAGRWSVLNVQPIQLTVGVKTDLTWNLEAGSALQPGDCVRLFLPSPYSDGSYSSFAQVGEVPCHSDDKNLHCTVEDGQTLRIDILNKAKSLSGRTIQNQFTNPYSQRLMRGITAELLAKCSGQPIEKGQIDNLRLEVAEIAQSQVQITSSSTKIGVQDSTYTFRLQPTTGLRTEGLIVVESPPWYRRAQFGMEGEQGEEYVEGLLNRYNSKVTQISASSGATVQLTDYYFNSKEGSLTIVYKANRTLTPADFVKITIDDVRTPVNSQEFVSGFSIQTYDAQGYAIDAGSSLTLATQMDTPQSIYYANVEILGGSEGEKAGMVATNQKLEVQINLDFPLDPFCYFIIQFPDQLTLGSNVQQVIGSGIFQPSSTSKALSQGQEAQFVVNAKKNLIQIEGCRLSQFLTERPYGSLTIEFVQMPEYVRSVDPISITAFSDFTLMYKIIDYSNGLAFPWSSMVPGPFLAELFRPSNYYASAQLVAYTLHVRPSHSLTVGSRITIQMPKTIKFETECEVLLTQSDCQIDTVRNVIKLTNIFVEEFTGGTLLKFMILSGTNPIGSRAAGPWSILSEILIDGKHYARDGQSFDESFFALSGQIFSTLAIDNLQVSSTETTYTMSFLTEQIIPPGGSLVIKVPVESYLPPTIQVEAQQMELVSKTDSTIKLFSALSINSPETSIEVVVKGVKNVRSMKPSSAFYIATMDSDGYVIDSGGQDIIVQMRDFAYFSAVSVQTFNKTNGAATTIEFSVDLQHPLKDGDVLHIELPENIEATEHVSCSTTNSGVVVQEITCQSYDSLIEITFVKVTAELGLLKIQVSHIFNPPSPRLSLPFRSFYTTDKYEFQSQTVHDASILVLQSAEPATLQSFKIAQETEEYNQVGKVTLEFTTMNPIDSKGVILLEWPASVQLFPETYCAVTTHKQILRQNTCTFDLAKRTLKIRDAFVEVPHSYQGNIQISLSKVKNPSTNQNMGSYTLTTFDDPGFVHKVDTLSFQPVLICHYPCQTCGQSKNYCTACHTDDPKNFLHTEGKTSTCLEACPPGWSSDGTYPRECQQCDFACKTCLDEGGKGDVLKCVTCTERYPFFLTTQRNFGQCLFECPQGFFDNGQKVCKKCFSQCQECADSAFTCTNCDYKGALPVLLENKCLSECPDDHTDMMGTCRKCQSPCATCDGDQKSCLSCDGINGIKYRFGFECYTDCPAGTSTNAELNICEGCRTGCEFCEFENPKICLRCQEGYLSLKDECVTVCPEGTVTNFQGDMCLSLTEIDARLVYFPLLIMVVLIALISFVGRVVKPHHLVLSNFVIMLGLLEHCGLIAQVILTFIYGTYKLAIIILLVWLGYLATLVAFNVLWHRRIVNQDPKFAAYRVHPDNKLSTMVRSTLAKVVSWRSQKLLYSHFFGVHINSFAFEDGERVVRLMLFTTVANVGLTFAPLVAYNAYCLLGVMLWGTQLQIIQIENIGIALIASLCSLIEHRQMKKIYGQIASQKKVIKSNKQQAKGKKLSLVFTKFKGEPGNPASARFVDRKLQELIVLFGARKCCSLPEVAKEPKEVDPRINRSFPMSPQLPPVKVDRNPKPLPLKTINNCYNETFLQMRRKMIPFNGNGVNKATQKGGHFENDLHRADSFLVSVTENEPLKSDRSESRRYRGRKTKLNLTDLARATLFDQESINTKAEVLTSIREEDEMLAKKRIISKKTHQPPGTNKTSISGVSPRRVSKPTLHSNKSQPSTAEERVTLHSSIEKKSENRSKQTAQEMPDANLRNFNENDIMGNVKRDLLGNVVISKSTDADTGKPFWQDIDGRRTTAEGYLINPQGQILSRHDSRVVMFEELVNGYLPAPFLFERYNFNPFKILGRFTNYRNLKDAQSMVLNKGVGGAHYVDESQKKVNSQGFMCNAKNDLIDRQGRVVFDSHQLKDRQLPQLYTYSGEKFSIFDVMGCLPIDNKHQVVFSDSKKTPGCKVDLSGHPVSDRGYLINEEGDIVNRSGVILFKANTLKNGEFPKIFQFSRFEVKNIQGTYKKNADGKPILHTRPDGILQDDNARAVNQRGYLTDDLGNIVDQNQNKMFEFELVSNELKLPPVLTKQKLVRQASHDEISDILQMIEDDLASSGHDVSLTQFTPTSTRQLLGIRTFNNESPVRIAPPEQRSSNSSKSPERKMRSGKKLQVQMVRQESWHEKDIMTANIYGGEAKPRVRMVPKRFQSRERGERSTVLRNSSILSPTQINVGRNHAQRTSQMIQTQKLEINPHNNYDVTSRESNQAISVKNFRRKKFDHKQHQLALNQEELSKFVDSGLPVQSVGDLTRSEAQFNANNDEDRLNRTGEMLLKQVQCLSDNQ